jgi:hypothetical protein
VPAGQVGLHRIERGLIRHLGQKRHVGKRVDHRAARLGETEPGAPVEAALQVVGISGQVVEERRGLRRGASYPLRILRPSGS